MAISLLDNISIKKKAPNVERDLFATVADMAAYNENYLPDVFECNVIEDGNRYRYNRTNIVDPELGKWRIVESGAGAELIDYYKKTEVDELLDKKVSAEEGKGLSANDYTTLEKEKLASLENYDDSEVRKHITNSEQAIADIQSSMGSDTLTTTATTVKGAINEVKTNAEAASTLLGERLTATEKAIAIINGDSTVTGSIKKSASNTLKDAKSYTDQKLAEMAANSAINCDEKPTYFDDGSGTVTITYIKDGQPLTTTDLSTWFYYTQDDKLMQTIFIKDSNDGTIKENSVVSAGETNFEDFVSKSKDIVDTYTGDEADTSKVGNLGALQALEQKVNTSINERVKTTDIYDALDSTSVSTPLSANQGRVLNEKVDTKLDKTFSGEGAGSKHLVTDSLGNIILADYDATIDPTSANAVQNKVIKTEFDKKFNIAQDTEKAGYVAVIGEDGNMTFTEPTTLGGKAEIVTYTNEDYPDLINVDLALDKILGKLYYEAPKITSFTMTPATEVYEIGTVIPADTIEFSWAVSKEVKSQALTDCTIVADDRSATYGNELSNSKTFILTVSDGSGNEGSVVTASKKISFLNKGYWGSAAIPDEYNSEFILGLTNNKFISSNKGDYNFNVGAGEYGYFAVPSTMKFTTIWVNGFQADVEEVATVSFTNASGHTSTYAILKTTQSALGTFVATVK